MIIEEFLNDNTLVKHYSDKGFLLLQNETDIKYSDPIDAVPCIYTYTETDELYEEPEEENNEETLDNYNEIDNKDDEILDTENQIEEN